MLLYSRYGSTLIVDKDMSGGDFLTVSSVFDSSLIYF